MCHGDPSSQSAKDFQPPTRMKRPTMGFAACLGQRGRAVWACTCGQAALRRSRSACHSIAQGCCQGFRVLMLFLIQNPTRGLQEKAPFVYSHNCYKRTRYATLLKALGGAVVVMCIVHDLDVKCQSPGHRPKTSVQHHIHK